MRHASQLECSVASLINYRDNFTGTAFDAPDLQPNKMTAQDLFLVGSLSMSDFTNLDNVGDMRDRFYLDEVASASCRTQATCTSHFHCVLSRIPATATIHGVDASSSLWADVNRLWELVGPLVGVTSPAPPSRTKPLARKRPGLIPILDTPGSIAYLQKHGISSGSYWSTILKWMQSPAVAFGIALVRGQGAGEGMSDLRVVDVLVWMSMMRPNSRCDYRPA